MVKAARRPLLNPPDLGKILRKGGVNRARRDIIDTMNVTGEHFLTEVLFIAILIALQTGKVTVKLDHLKAACAILGIKCAVGFNPTAQITPSLVTGKAYPRRGKISPETGEKKTRKFKQGTVTAREVVFLQRKDNLVFKKLTFRKFCSALARDSSVFSFNAYPNLDLSTLRFSSDISVVLQVICERYLISLARCAAGLAKASGQKTVNTSHINSTISIIQECGTFAGFV